MNETKALHSYEPKYPSVTVHGPDEFEAMRNAGQLAAEVLDFITPSVVPGVTTGKLDTLCHDFILDHDAIPAPLNYRGFPKSICTSVNHVVCHGIPNEAKKLSNGDIVNIDITVILDGWHGDTSRMFLVGDKTSVRARKLVDITYQSMMRGIEVVKPGTTLGDIGHAIQSFAESHRFSVVRDFCGHGIGRTGNRTTDHEQVSAAIDSLTRSRDTPLILAPAAGRPYSGRDQHEGGHEPRSKIAKLQRRANHTIHPCVPR